MKVKFKNDEVIDGHGFSKDKTYDFPEWIARAFIDGGVADGAFKFGQESEKKPDSKTTAKKKPTAKKKKKTTTKKKK